MTTLPYVGVDILIDRNRQRPVFLEINDHPTGFFGATDLSLHPNISDEFLKLIPNIEDNFVCFLLPDFFEINNVSHATKNFEIPTNCGDSIVTLLEEFKVQAGVLKRNKIDFIFCDIKGISIKNNKCICEGKIVKTLIRRANYFPNEYCDVYSINDIRARHLCLDKKATFDILKSIGGNFLPGLPYLDLQAIIKKPRYGSSSRDIEKLVYYQKAFECLDTDNDFIFQEWIEPELFEIDNNKYYFDLRLFLLNGKVKQIKIRTSCFQVGQSKYDWLTTTGNSCIVYDSINGFNLDKANSRFINLFQEAIKLSEKIVTHMDNHIRKQDLKDSIKKTPSLEKMWGLKVKLENVILTPIS